tara:strand:+ start:233 stop:430 length:198 start_codon:yes stop_codon:yes gene_type:complete
MPKFHSKANYFNGPLRPCLTVTNGATYKEKIMETLSQTIFGVLVTLFLAATLLDMFYTLRGDYDN